MRIAFAGTPEFAVPPLTALVASTHELVAVYTQPDRARGRGQRVQPSAVKRAAAAARIPVHQPATLRAAGESERLQALDLDLLIVAAYGLILPPQILALPRLGCINIHASLLPRWRGAAPVQRAILAGDEKTGITLMQMDSGLDTGPILYTVACSIGPDESAGELHDRLARLGRDALLRGLQRLVAGDIEPLVQNERLATYAPKIDKSEAVLDWRQPATQLHRAIRAFNPWPVAQTSLGAETLRIWRAHPLRSRGEPATAAPGRVIATGAEGIDVATGAGILRLTEVQRTGRRRMTAAEFVNARPMRGEQLGD